MNELETLPKGWIKTTLGIFSEITLGQSPSSEFYNEEKHGLPFYQGKLEFGKMYPTPRKWCSQPKKIAENGDVLISVRAPVGDTNVCQEQSCIGRGLASIRGLCGVDTFFILFLLKLLKPKIEQKGTGTTFSAISGNNLRSLEVNIPPLGEQKRIVSKIEELFSELDNVKDTLQKVKLQLVQYRQSLLKSVFENKDWEYVRFGDFLTLEYGKSLSKKDRKEGNIPVFGSSGIGGYHNKALVENSSLVIGRKGNAGNVLLVEQAFWAIDTTYFLKETKDYNLKFLYHLFKFLNFGKLDSSTAIPSLRRDDVYAQSIPLPEMKKQNDIVSQIEQGFSLIENTESITNTMLKQLNTLRSSILKQAFEGKLVPQDPNDEPAEKLLQRIKEQQSKAKPRNKK